jgi:divalent anion:Na+ symporter, DASS family
MSFARSLPYLPLPLPFFSCLFFGLLLWFAVPMPEALSPKAWHLLIIFITTIIAVISKPLPMGAVCLIALVISVLTNTLQLTQTLSGFQDKASWLIIFALFIAKGFQATGLGKRLGYYFIALLGKSTLGLSYGIAAADLCMAPVIPSVTGRSAGIVFPIVRAISDSFQSFPHEESAKKMGSFLTLSLFQSTTLSSTMFLTAMVANPLIQTLAKEHLQIDLSWATWALGALVPGLCCFFAIPFIIYKLFPPSIKDTPEATQLARDELRSMGKMSLAEWVMLGTVVLLLLLWGGGNFWGIDPVLTAAIGLTILLLGGVLSWTHLLKDESVWEIFIWFSILLMMAKYLGEFGAIMWFKEAVASYIHGLTWMIAFPILALLYFYSHYFFASSTAHVLAMFPAIAGLSISLGTPPLLTVIVLAYFSNLMGGLTHYSLIPAPILFGAGYNSIQRWWACGFILSVSNILIFSTIGLAWWHFLGWL